MMVFQDYVLFPWKSIFENVYFAIQDNKEISKKEKKELVDKYLKLVGLIKFRDWPIHKLSGGMMQRVAIARALVVNPKLLLMDEPFSALDSQYRHFLREKVEEIWQKTKKTIIFVTHSISEAIYLADRIYLFGPAPGNIKKTYEIKLKRPRDKNSLEFLKLKKEIEKEMKSDFDQLILDRKLDTSIEKHLKNIGL
jgi:NitT/TauT family transport system ATP-binding protein